MTCCPHFSPMRVFEDTAVVVSTPVAQTSGTQPPKKQENEGRKSSYGPYKNLLCESCCFLVRVPIPPKTRKINVENLTMAFVRIHYVKVLNNLNNKGTWKTGDHTPVKRDHISQIRPNKRNRPKKQISKVCWIGFTNVNNAFRKTKRIERRRKTSKTIYIHTYGANESGPGCPILAPYNCWRFLRPILQLLDQTPATGPPPRFTKVAKTEIKRRRMSMGSGSS